MQTFVEYGTTIQEKRSVGVKICRGLLEKIKYDLVVARTDNDVDMRYLINMDYSADLPINTMGRRIRTRLYFTSESHLHTVINVLRFGTGCQIGKPMLSDDGVAFINSTPELCYLTQVVMRVFEDTRLRCMNDPRRFRVEILFSPGATAPPRHLQELDRDLDTSRFETAPLEIIGRDGLTCEELEAFFDTAIQAGKSEDGDEALDIKSQSTHPHSALRKSGGFGPNPSSVSTNKGKMPQTLHQTDAVSKTNDQNNHSNLSDQCSTLAADDKMRSSEKLEPNIEDSEVLESKPSEWELVKIKTPATDKEPTQHHHDPEGAAHRILSRKIYWGAVAVSSFVLGSGCLLFALHLSHGTNSRRGSGIMTGGNVRRWTTAKL